MSGKSFVYSLALCFLAGGVAVVQAAPTLSVGAASGKAGTAVDLPVTFDSSGGSVSSLQFNLILPVSVSTVSVASGANLSTAGKTVIEHRRGNTWSFIVYGPKNQNPIKSGTLLTAKVLVAPGTAAGPLEVSLNGVVYANPKGQAISPGAGGKASSKIVVTP